MIKISKYIYIHWLFAVVFAVSYINRNLEGFVLSYAVITIHELTHLAAAKFLGLTVSHIVFYPFGLNLKLKNELLYSISDEIILYLSGPLSNAAMAFAGLIFYNKSSFFCDFYYRNILFFVINLLPMCPLDGGMAVKKLLCYKLGFDKGVKYSKIISVICAACLLVFCYRLFVLGGINSSLCIFIVFLIGNILFSREKYNQNFLKELLYCKNKKSQHAYNAKILGAKNDADYTEIAKKLNMADSYFIIFTNENQKVTKIMSEDELIGCILDNNDMNI